MDEISMPTPDECLENPELAPLALLEAAIQAACRSLSDGQTIMDLNQDWFPAWKLPRTGQGWTTYWIISAAGQLREAITAYRCTLSYDRQISLRLEPGTEPDRPF